MYRDWFYKLYERIRASFFRIRSIEFDVEFLSKLLKLFSIFNFEVVTNNEY